MIERRQNGELSGFSRQAYGNRRVTHYNEMH